MSLEQHTIHTTVMSIFMLKEITEYIFFYILSLGK